MVFELVLHDKIKRFEEILLEKAGQEKRTKGKGHWLNVAERYLAQKERLKLYPWPEEFNDQTPLVLHKIIFALSNVSRLPLNVFLNIQYNTLIF